MAVNRLLRSLRLLAGLQTLRGVAPELDRAYAFALEDAKRAAREYTAEMPTVPSTPAAKRSSEPPQGKT